MLPFLKFERLVVLCYITQHFLCYCYLSSSSKKRTFELKYYRRPLQLVTDHVRFGSCARLRCGLTCCLKAGRITHVEFQKTRLVPEGAESFEHAEFQPTGMHIFITSGYKFR
jgi:hypothetical protein